LVAHPFAGSRSDALRDPAWVRLQHIENAENGIVSELTVYVAMDEPVKFSVLKLRNVSGRARAISVTGFWEWVLGEQRPKSLLHVQTEVDQQTGALLARNFIIPIFLKWWLLRMWAIRREP